MRAVRRDGDLARHGSVSVYCTTPRHAASAVRIKTRQTGQYLAREQQQPAATIHYVYLIKSDLQLAGLGGALCNWSSIHSDGFIPHLARDQLRSLDSHQLTANVALSSRTCLLFKL